jgi:transposase
VVARLRPQPQEAFLRLQVFAGEQAQVDWALCRARHSAHYAGFRTMPSSRTPAALRARDGPECSA